MAIRDDNTPPSKPGSITQTADNQIDRIGNISNVSKTVSTMQKDVKQKITETKKMVDDSEAISSVQSSMSKVLDKLSDTIGALSSGVKTITVDTAKATKDAIGDYGKAISADISFNKQSVVAMALAKSTPIYGYFVAKFMETDIFKRAAERMKTSIGKAFGSLAGLFRRGAKEPGKEKIPHMARGGYVEKAGVAKIHAGEVVMPIEKILDRMDDSTNVAKNVGKILTKLTMQQATSHRMMTDVIMQEGDTGGKKVGLIKDTLKLIREGKERYKDPTEVRQLRELIAIREALGGELKIWPEVWSKLLMKHPGFRGMIAVTKLMTKFSLLVTWKPAYALFKRRGGYGSHLSKSDKPLNAMSQNIGLTYVESMWRFDNMLNLLKAIAQATRDTAATITGKKYSGLKGVGTGRWSLGGAAVRLSAWLTGKALSGLGKIPGLGTVGKAGKLLSGRAFSTKESREYALGEGKAGGIVRLGSSEQNPMYVTDLTWLPVQSEVNRIFTEMGARLPKKIKQDQLMIEYTTEQVSTMQSIKKRLKSNWIIKMLLIGWSFISMWMKKLWDKTAGKLLKFGGKKFASWLGLKSLGQFGAPKGSKGTIGRAMGKIPPGLRKAVGAGGIAASVAMGVYDAMQAVSMAKEWGTSKTSAGIGGFLGGTGAGLSGAMKGAAKGGMMGAGIGSFVGPIGTVIGGAVGVIAGGILGFIGGEKIAKGLDAMGGYIKKFVKATWSFITYPFRMMGKMWDWIKEQFTWKKLGEHASSAISLIWKLVKLPYKAVWWLLKKAGPAVYSMMGSLWDLIKEQFTLKNLGNIATGSISLIWKLVKLPFKGIGWILDQVKPYIADKISSVKDWVTDKFSLKNILNILSSPMDSLFGVFSWFGSLFGRMKEWIVEKIKKIPGASLFFKGDKGPDKEKKGGIKETITAATEAGQGATKSIWGGIKGLWGSKKSDDIAKQAKKGAEDAIKKTKNATSSVINKMTPQAREAFETAKKYYMKEFGWTEAQADAVLQTIAATAGDKLDLFSDPEKLKGMASSMYKSAGGNIKDRYLASIDKGQIVVNQATLMLANGELIADDLGKKIVESSKELGKQTLQGAGAIVSSVSSAVTNNNSTTSNTAINQGGSKSDGRSYFDYLVYTGNYR